MSGQRDFPLPIAGETAESAAENPWPVQIEPTNLIALWPGDSPPTRVEIFAALESHFDSSIEQVHELDSTNDVLWNAIVALPGVEAPVIIWAEPAKPLPAGAIDDPAASRCRWAVGAETVLKPEQAFDEYQVLLRCLAGGVPGPAILDVTTFQWYQGEFLSDLAATPPAEPPIEALWTIHSVGDRQSNPQGARWLHTHGLWRCGVPELEMLEVPADQARGAATLLNHLAAIVIDAGLPPAGEPFEIGPGLDLLVQPWQDLAGHVSADNSGGPQDRTGEDNPHGGVRAVVCDVRQKGMFRRLWVWPATAVARLDGDDGAVIYRSSSATERAARLARERWDELALAFASARAAGALAGPKRSMAFLVKATLGSAGRRSTDSTPEHLWFELQRFEGPVAHGQLINTPLDSPAPALGDIVAIRRDMVSDWSVYSAAGHFRPGDVPALRRVLSAMKGDKS